MNTKQRQRVLNTWFATYGEICFWCGKRFGFGPKSLPSLDHFIPRSRGGWSNPRNCVVAHVGCNARRGASMPTEADMRRFVQAGRTRAIEALKHYAVYLEHQIRRNQETRQKFAAWGLQ